VDEISSRLREVTDGISPRYDNNSNLPSARRSDYSSDDSRDSSDLFDSPIEENLEEEEEDRKQREEELKAELHVATKRVEELKHTVKQTKSFIQIASSQNLLPNPKSFVNGTIVSTIASEVDSDDDSDGEEDDEGDVYIVDESGEFETDYFEDTKSDYERKSNLPSGSKRGGGGGKSQFHGLEDLPSPSGKLADRVYRLKMKYVVAKCIST
jgi:hypothetical protein